MHVLPLINEQAAQQATRNTWSKQGCVFDLETGRFVFVLGMDGLLPFTTLNIDSLIRDKMRAYIS
jgi:hypothetical protein